MKLASVPVDALVAEVIGELGLPALRQERVQVLLKLCLRADAQWRPPAHLQVAAVLGLRQLSIDLLIRELLRHAAGAVPVSKLYAELRCVDLGINMACKQGSTCRGSREDKASESRQDLIGGVGRKKGVWSYAEQR